MNAVPGVADDAPGVPRIGGLSTLKGLILYGAVLTFAGLYLYFMVEISTSAPGRAPSFDGALTAAAAALAGVVGSAFALEIGTPSASTNEALSQSDKAAQTARAKALVRVWQALSIDAKDVNSPSWPKTLGIWLYAVVASAVAVTYVLNQNETPQTIRALAVAFGGYVIALVSTAYKSST